MRFNSDRLQIAIIALLSIFITACEPYKALTYRNETPVPVNVITYTVPSDFSNVPKPNWNDPGDVINAGESKKMVTPVSNVRADYYKWVTTAVAENGTIFLSKIYTWDELHSMNFTILIEPPK